VVTVPSDTVASKVYVLSEPISPGASKFGAVENETTPVDESMINKASSLEEDESTSAYVRVVFESSSLAASVTIAVWFSSTSVTVSVSKVGASFISRSLT